MARHDTTALRRPPTGLDRGARIVLLQQMPRGVGTREALHLFFHGVYADIEDYMDGLNSSWGAGTAERFRERANEVWRARIDQSDLDWEGATRRAHEAFGELGVALAMPEPDFLTLLETGYARDPDPFRRAGGLAAAVNQVCQRRGVPWKLVGVGTTAEFEWVGDAETEERVLRPALSALDDPRLANGPRQDYSGARDQLRVGTPVARKLAVGEACAAVESALKVLLTEHGHALPKKQSLDALIGACRDAALFPAAVDGSGVPVEQILAAPGRVGNRRGRHGAGPVPHDVHPDEAEAVVASAAVALTLVARRLPAR